jgi:hypothetical protein
MAITLDHGAVRLGALCSVPGPLQLTVILFVERLRSSIGKTPSETLALKPSPNTSSPEVELD